MVSRVIEQVFSKAIEIHTCEICQRIAFPPVKWNVENPNDSNIPKCNHMYCLNCTRSYFQLDLKVSDRREVRNECCVCCQPLNRGSCVNGQPKNAKDIYYHCNSDEYLITELLIIHEGERECDIKGCTFKTTSPEKMRKHLIDECDYNILNCNNRKNGCNFRGYRKEIKNHESQCEFCVIKCLLCSINIRKTDKISHLTSFHRIDNNFDKFHDLFDQTLNLSLENAYINTSCVSVQTSNSNIIVQNSNY